MTGQAPVASQVLHAVRLLGFGDTEAVADRTGMRLADAMRALHGAKDEGWVQHSVFADLEGWSLTESGKAEKERHLAAERRAADADDVVGAAYRDFLPLNARLLRAVSAWQIKPTDADHFAPNDHADQRWDGRVLDELTALSQELAPLEARLCAVLPRFDGYASRFNAALEQAGGGQHDWVDTTSVDSCHRVWFQLHEDLVATLGVYRGSEDVTE